MLIKQLKNNSYILSYLILIIIVFGIFSITIPSSFLSTTNLQSMAFQFPEFGILALAMTIAIITGGIDLSIISTANLCSIIAATSIKILLTNYPETNVIIIIVVVLSVSLLTGLMCGLINGFLIALIGISPILATIGTMKLYEGIAMIVSNGQAISNFPIAIQFIGNGLFGPIPFSVIIFIFVVIVVNIFLQKTSIGFTIFMLGSNPVAARFSGLNNKTIVIRVYVISGLLSGIAAIVMMSRFNSAKVGYGNSYLLLTVLVAILGGVDPAGGKGNIFGVVFSILLLQFISSGFSLIGFSDYIRNVIYGAVLILVMMFKYIYPLLKNRTRDTDKVI